MDLRHCTYQPTGVSIPVGSADTARITAMAVSTAIGARRALLWHVVGSTGSRMDSPQSLLPAVHSKPATRGPLRDRQPARVPDTRSKSTTAATQAFYRTGRSRQEQQSDRDGACPRTTRLHVGHRRTHRSTTGTHQGSVEPCRFTEQQSRR